MQHSDSLFGTLKQGFQYGRYANLLWLERLERTGFGEPDKDIFRHILGAEHIWLLRVQGSSPTAFELPEPTAETIGRLQDGWQDALAANRHDPAIAFKRINGEAQELKFTEIARHVINHGTYHRGELRGLCRARGEEDFPETDLAGYYFQPGARQ